MQKMKVAKMIRQKGALLPSGLTTIMNLSHQEIINYYNAKIRGIVNFYSFATNKSGLYSVI